MVKFLYEEFFGKLWKFSNNVPVLPIRFILKAFFIIIAIIFLIFIVWGVLTKNYFLVGVVIGLMLLGELAHYLRKKMEESVKLEIENNPDNLKKQSPRNKSLLKMNPYKEDIKNNDLLKNY